MRIHIGAANVDSSYQVLGIKGSLCASYPSIKERKGEWYLSPFKSRKLFKSLALLDRCGSRGVHSRRVVCEASLDEGFAQNHVLDDEDGDHGFLITRVGCTTTETKPSPSNDGYRLLPKGSFWKSQVDLLEPRMLGIRPEVRDWPERESLVWADVEQKARSFGVPLSLKIIQKRNRMEGCVKDMGEAEFSSMAKAFSSVVSTIVELQSRALQMREVLCDEDLGLIISGVQRDMHSSFVWLFQQVFSRTPDLMVHVMTLLADFSVHSTSQYSATAQISTEEKEPLACLDTNRSVSGIDLEFSEYGNRILLQLGDRALRNEAEVSLWSSFLDEAKSLLQEGAKELVLDHDVLKNMVSPISVEIESDNYLEFLRTDLMYQMRLSQEPENQLLLSNYAQYLQLVAHDYERAEECFKRAIQVQPPDAESISRYAEFLWMVRKDLWRAEEAFLQALSIEPENSYYASKYANFLWNTGGDETCYPLDECSDV